MAQFGSKRAKKIRSQTKACLSNEHQGTNGEAELKTGQCTVLYILFTSPKKSKLKLRVSSDTTKSVFGARVYSSFIEPSHINTSKV